MASKSTSSSTSKKSSSAPKRSSKPAPRKKSSPRRLRTASSNKPSTSKPASSNTTSSGTQSREVSKSNKPNKGSADGSGLTSEAKSNDIAKTGERSEELKGNLLSGWGLDEKENSDKADAKKTDAEESKTGESQKSGGTNSESAKPKEPTKADLDQKVRQDFQNLARDNPQQMTQLLQQAFPNATDTQRQELAEKMANGTAPTPKNLQLVDPSALEGANAGYSAENGGTVSLSRDLLGNPSQLAQVYTEEVGHHLDNGFGRGDAPGDEGQILAEGVDQGGALSQERLSQLRRENDKGKLTLNGKTTDVENSSGHRFNDFPGRPNILPGQPGGGPNGQNNFPGQPNNPPGLPGGGPNGPGQGQTGDARGGVDPTTGQPNVSAPSNAPGGLVGDPNRYTGAAANIAQNPQTAHLMNNLASHDEQTRQAAAQELATQMQGMDPASQRQMTTDLARIAGVPEETLMTGLRKGEQQYTRIAAMEALQAYGLDNLSTDQLDTLAGALSDVEPPGMAAADMFGNMAADPYRSQNNQYATETLRNLTQVKDDFNTAGRAADALALAEGQPQFKEEDYQRLLNGATNRSYGAGQRAQRVLGEAAALEGSSPAERQRQDRAIETLRDNLANDHASGDHHRVASEAMGQAVNNLEAEDSELLGDVASHSTNGASRSALETLQKAALREEDGPVDGAANAISEVLDDTADVPGTDRHEMVSQTARDTFREGNDEVKSDIANSIFRADKLDNKQAGQALDILRSRTDKNPRDEKAITGLGYAMNNEEVSHGNRLVAADSLGDTAGKGSEPARELLTDALNSGEGNRFDGGFYESERKDRQLNWMAARGLGRAAEAGDEKSLDALKDGYTNGVKRGDKGEYTAEAAMEQLGQLGGKWGKDNAQGEEIRSFVRDALTKGDGGAAYAMADMAQHLGKDDVQALLQQYDKPASDDHTLSGGVDSALKSVVEKQSDTHGKPVLDHVRGSLETNPLRAMSAMEDMAQHLRPDDVKAITGQLDKYGDRTVDVLAKINGNSDNNAVKLEAAKALAQPENFAKLEPDQRRDLIDTVALNGSQELKSQLRGQLGVEAPMSMKALGRIGEEFTSELEHRIKEAHEAHPLSRSDVQKQLLELADLSRAQAIANNPKNKNAPHINKKKLNDKLTALSEKLGPEFENIRTMIQNRHKDLGAKQGDFLQGQDFRDLLRLTPADQRANIAKSELAKLSAIDPNRAREVQRSLGEQLSLMQAQEAPNSLRLFQGQNARIQAQTIDGINQSLFGSEQPRQEGGGIAKDSVGTAGSVNQVASRSQSALNAVDAHNIARLMQQVDPKSVGNAADLSKVFRGNWQTMASELGETVRRLEKAGDSEALAKAKGALSSLNRIKDWASKVDEVGGWGSISAGLGVTSLALGGMPKNLNEGLRATTSVMSVAGNLDDVGKLTFAGSRRIAQGVFGAGSKVDDLAKLGTMQGVSKGLKALKWMGPLSDIGSGSLDAYQSYKEFAKGDIHGGIGMGISAGGSLAAGAAGLALLAGASGPAAPIVLVGGTIVGIGGMVYNARYGMTPEQEFLDGLGIYTHPHSITRDARRLGHATGGTGGFMMTGY